MIRMVSERKGRCEAFALLISDRKPTLDHRISSCYPNSELFLKG